MGKGEKEKKNGEENTWSALKQIVGEKWNHVVDENKQNPFVYTRAVNSFQRGQTLFELKNVWASKKKERER